jgi:hypothetical protein
MNIRCVFHVSPTVTNTPLKRDPEPIPASVDIAVAGADAPRPRGRSFETWSRGRGWTSED